MARDVFSVIHFPMLCGVIAMAVAFEEGLLHSAEPLEASLRVALGAGAVLFVGGSSIALWRATSRVLVARVGALLAGSGVIAIVAEPPWMSFSVLLAALALVALIERDRSEGRLHPS